ncbi:hypothetical protein SAMN05443144_12220 [Fodinibius roseus]|uniref:Uncharacterized protein n=1 Tax=Fodinibius roseus TaxID=1194090 RepID=A0A1M5I4B0_9BACT|nr:hypothetical protein SAMN05443144_12220 [Fodinibius roseus]
MDILKEEYYLTALSLIPTFEVKSFQERRVNSTLLDGCNLR